jgi:Xaa-Pro aminopeptidase
MVSHEKAMRLKAKLGPLDSGLFYPLHDLVDLVWQYKPPRSQEPVYVQGIEFTGMSTNSQRVVSHITNRKGRTIQA